MDDFIKVCVYENGGNKIRYFEKARICEKLPSIDCTLKEAIETAEFYDPFYYSIVKIEEVEIDCSQSDNNQNYDYYQITKFNQESYYNEIEELKDDGEEITQSDLEDIQNECTIYELIAIKHNFEDDVRYDDEEE